MAEVSRKVVPYEYNYVCDKCENGMMTVTGDKDNEGYYPHKCMICGHIAALQKSYPRVEYFSESEKSDK